MESDEDFQSVDVALAVGANDIINPAARTKENSPLYGMPILNADQARTVILGKRSLNPGFAGQDNPWFYAVNTMKVFGDAKPTRVVLGRLMRAG